MQHSHKPKNSNPVPEGESALCAVMGDIEVNKLSAQDNGLIRNINGKTYYLCCQGCAADFDKNPAVYAK